MASEAMQRLLTRIEDLTGLDLGQRIGEVEQWLRSRGTLPEDAVALARFCDQLARKGCSELAALLGRVTVSYTRFFRDAEQLAAVARALAGTARRPLRLWIAGCSTGEEAYTMALLCREQGCEVDIVASDINPWSLAHARAGCYPREVLKGVPAQHQEDFLPCGDAVEVSPRLRRQVRFVEHSLMQPPLRPAEGADWDAILCRNVLIYFRVELSERVLAQLAAVVAPSGYIILGTSEFHLRTPELLPARFGERVFLQRTSEPRPPPAPALALLPAAPAAPAPRVRSLPQAARLPATPNPAERGVTPPATLVVLLFSGNHDAVLREALPVLMRDAGSEGEKGKPHANSTPQSPARGRQPDLPRHGGPDAR